MSCDVYLSDSCNNKSGVCTDTSGCKPGWQYGQRGGVIKVKKLISFNK